MRKGLFLWPSVIAGLDPTISFQENIPMKLDPIFTVKNHKLYKISDNSAVDTATLKQIEIKWSTVEISDEAYNEEYLAALREELKAMDDAGTFAVLVPVVDKPLENADQLELFINAFKSQYTPPEYIKTRSASVEK